MCRPCSEESPCQLDADWTSEKNESIQREIESCKEAARQCMEEKKDNQMTQIEETTAPECTDLSDVPQTSLAVSENPEFKSTMASMILSIIGNQQSQSKAPETWESWHPGASHSLSTPPPQESVYFGASHPDERNSLS